jgi:hypothetical protein
MGIIGGMRKISNTTKPWWCVECAIAEGTLPVRWSENLEGKL